MAPNHFDLHRYYIASNLIILESNFQFFKDSKLVIMEHHPEFDSNGSLIKIMKEYGFKVFRESGIDKTWVKK